MIPPFRRGGILPCLGFSSTTTKRGRKERHERAGDERGNHCVPACPGRAQEDRETQEKGEGRADLLALPGLAVAGRRLLRRGCRRPPRPRSFHLAQGALKWTPLSRPKTGDPSLHSVRP